MAKIMNRRFSIHQISDTVNISYSVNQGIITNDLGFRKDSILLDPKMDKQNKSQCVSNGKWFCREIQTFSITLALNLGYHNDKEVSQQEVGNRKMQKMWKVLEKLCLLFLTSGIYFIITGCIEHNQ